MQDLRDIIDYGIIQVSVQASSHHYCSPREDGRSLDFYDSVEVGILGPKDSSDDGRGLVMPSRVGVGGFDHFFEDCGSPIAGYLPQGVLAALLDQLQAAAR